MVKRIDLRELRPEEFGNTETTVVAGRVYCNYCPKEFVRYTDDDYEVYFTKYLK